MKSEVVGWPSAVTDLVQSVDKKICERWCFIISELLCRFPQILLLIIMGLSQLG
jgi:hypothetical protein